MRRRTRLGLAAFLLVLTGCSSGSTDTAPSPSSSPAVAPTQPPAPDPPPKVGSCHTLTVSSAAQPTDTRPAVTCRQRHTSVTVYAGRLDAVVDGHLLAVDSRHVQQQIAQRCPRTLAGFVGGDRTARRLSRFTIVWFSPTVEQADLGADWFRCDLVAVAGEGRLAPLRPHMRGILDQHSALDDFGTCGTTAPDKKSFSRVTCSERHSWRAVDVIGLPRHARYLGKKADSAANDACKQIASDRSSGALKFTWSFEWPTHDQWAGGQRYGYCWLPKG